MPTLTHEPPAAGALPGSVRLLLSPRVPLVKMDTVIAACGEIADIIHGHVEKGRLRWVFNVATNPSGIRDLRFWNREVSAFSSSQRSELAALREATVQSVVDRILGVTPRLTSGQVCLLLGIRRPTLMDLRQELQGDGREFFPRRGLERFLKRRLLR